MFKTPGRHQTVLSRILTQSVFFPMKCSRQTSRTHAKDSSRVSHQSQRPGTLFPTAGNRVPDSRERVSRPVGNTAQCRTIRRRLCSIRGEAGYGRITPSASSCARLRWSSSWKSFFCRTKSVPRYFSFTILLAASSSGVPLKRMRPSKRR